MMGANVLVINGRQVIDNHYADSNVTIWIIFRNNHMVLQQLCNMLERDRV